MKIVSVIGARPQFVKAAVMNRLIRNEANIEEVLIHTGQHFDANMSDVFFEELDIDPPKYNLGISGGSHGFQTGQMISGIEEMLILEKPDYVLLYGDTNSTLAGAVAAAKLYIPIIHVEAGLRSRNEFMPEEINRILVDRVSKILITTSARASDNLVAEGIDKSNIFEFGDIMYDAIKSVPETTVNEDFDILCTVHRPVNTDNFENLKTIVEFLGNIAENKSVLLLLHPRTRMKLLEFDLHDKISRLITIKDPCGYVETINYLRNCELLITDSGGMQKEAYYCGKNSLVLRDETEWVELVEAKVSRLLRINDLVNLTIEDIVFSSDFSENIYGKGTTGKLIVNILKKIEGIH